MNRSAAAPPDRDSDSPADRNPEAPADPSEEHAEQHADESSAETAEAAEAAEIQEIAAEAPPAPELPQLDEPADEPRADVLSADPAHIANDNEELKAALEALLFTSPDPLSARKLANALGNIDTKIVREGVQALREDYASARRGVQIVEVPGGYQMASEPRFAEYVLALGSKKKPQSLSPAMLETLAIIAYRQPVIRAVVESIRGVESSGVMRNLLDLDLIAVVGRKEVVGRPQLYGTTEKFLRTFGLTRIDDLPSIRGLREKMREEEERERQAEAEARAKAAENAPGEVASDSESAEPAPGDTATANASEHDESAAADSEDSAGDVTFEEPADSSAPVDDVDDEALDEDDLDEEDLDDEDEDDDDDDEDEDEDEEDLLDDDEDDERN